MIMMICLECGEEWGDDGTIECPFCGSEDIDEIDDTDERRDDEEARG